MTHPSIRPLQRSKYTALLVYGMWSVGKTVFAGTSPGRTLILRPPTDHTDSIVTPRPELSEAVMTDWDVMAEMGEYLRSDGGKDWDWVWLDSVSLWQDVGLDDIWAATIANKPERAQKHAGMDKGEYGRNMERLKAWVRAVVGYDSFNFGITAHPTERLDDPAGERKQMPWVQGKNMSVSICGYMNLVAYYEVKHGESGPYRLLHTESTSDFYCKNQYAPPGQPWAPLLNPTMPDLTQRIDAVRGTLQTASGAAAAGSGPTSPRPRPTPSARQRPRPSTPAPAAPAPRQRPRPSAAAA